jgi:NADH-quinone oxidoreductase subunit H
VAEYFDSLPYVPTWLAQLLAAGIACFLIINLVAVGALVFIWMERKVSARIQDRLGPTRVGGGFGWLQTLADGLKLITKEDLAPGNADKLLFRFAPYISFAASYAAYIALPFASGWAAQLLNTSVFFILAVLGLEVFGVILGGYASGSKWSLFGGMRAASQVVSFEVPLALCALIPTMVAGTMNLSTIGEMQRGLFTNWFIFHDPFMFIIFFVFFTCVLASVNRAPFDLPEAESELVAGFLTEYSGLRWSFFFMAEYGSMFLVSGLATILFFGGWNGPIPLFDILGWHYDPLAPTFSWLWWQGAIANTAGVVNFIFKSVLFVTLMMWVRWTLPRLRIDQVMTTCWKYCVPIGCICFVGVTTWQVLQLGSINDIAPSRLPGEVREHWTDAPRFTPVAAESAEPPHHVTALEKRSGGGL